MRGLSCHVGVDASPGSKVQNNAMWAWFGNEGTEVFLELQPLMRKDAVTLTHALVQTVGYAADASVSKRSAPAPPPLRLLHLLSRDGIATNMAAARRLLHHVSQQGSLQYRLLVWSCASHQVPVVFAVKLFFFSTGGHLACPSCLHAS